MITKKLRYFLFLTITLVSQFIFGQPPQMPPTTVHTLTVSSSSWQPSVDAVGTLTAQNSVKITPEISGRITKIYFKSGEMVEKDQPLIQILPDIIKANLKKEQSALSVSKSNYQRLSKLAKKGYVDAADLEKAKSQVEQEQSIVDALQTQLDQTTIRAPFDGKIGLRKVSVGDLVATTQILTTLQSIDQMQVDFNVPEQIANIIHTGDTIEVLVSGIAKPFPATVTASDAAIDPQTRTLTIRAELPNPDHTLIPGSFANIRIHTGQAQKAILIPTTAVVFSDQGDYVYRIINKKAVKTKIKLGTRLEENKIITTAGLTPGDIIVTAGQEKLHDQAPVAVINK